MTNHDSVRAARACAALGNPDSKLEGLYDAIRGIQSTDDPSLCVYEDQLWERVRTIESKIDDWVI